MNKVEALENEVRGLKRQLNAAKKPSLFSKIVAGTGAVLVIPFEKLEKIGEEKLVKKHYTNEAERKHAERMAEIDREERKKAGLPDLEEEFYDES